MKRHQFLVAIGVAALTAACGSTSAKPNAASTTTAPAKAPPVIDITASGSNGSWSFALPPSGITGGVVTLRLTNKSDQDTHDIQLARVDGTHTADEVKAVVSQDGNPIPDWLHAEGGVGSTAPGQSVEATMSLPAGHYFYFCTEDTNGTSHTTNGMFGETDVSGDSGAALPTPTAHIDASEYKFETSGLKAGDNLVEFKNVGQQLHLAFAAPIADGKTLDDVKAAFSSDDQSAPPPVDFEKAVETDAIDPGGSIFVNWNLPSGKYALICFMTDRAGGPPHFMNGMLQELDIS